MKKRMSWYWAVPGATGLALIMAAVLLLVATAGRTPTASAQADCTLTITKAADVAIAPIGGSVVYTLTVHNTGLGACTVPVVVDDLADHLDCTATTQPTGWTATAANGCTGAAGAPVTWTAATLATGATATFTLTATITGAANLDEIANVATVDANDVTAPGLPALVTSNSVTVTVNDCDLTISKDSDDNEVGEGGEIVYTIHVENVGTADCADVIISETIPNDTDCIATDVIEANSDVDIADAEGCDASGDVTWDVTQGTLDGLEPGDEAEVEMTVKLTSGASDGDEIDNTACVVSDDTDAATEICDALTVDVEGVAATATPTTAPTATRGPTAQPLPTIQAPPPIPAARPIAPPITGTGPDGGSGPLVLGLGLVGVCLLLVSGAAMVKRTR